MDEKIKKILKNQDPNSIRDFLLAAIKAERDRQINLCKHGGDTENFDSKNTQNDWIAFIVAYAGRASARCGINRRQSENFAVNMTKVAALALAALEAHVKGYC